MSIRITAQCLLTVQLHLQASIFPADLTDHPSPEHQVRTPPFFPPFTSAFLVTSSPALAGKDTLILQPFGEGVRQRIRETGWCVCRHLCEGV